MRAKETIGIQANGQPKSTDIYYSVPLDVYDTPITKSLPISSAIAQAKGFTYAGNVIDSVSGQPLPGATVTLFAGGEKIAQGAASANGSFSFILSQPADSITISSASYKAMSWPASSYQQIFELERNITTLDEVIVTSKKKSDDYAWLLLLGLPFLMKGKPKGRKKVSGIEAKDVMTGALVVAAFYGFDIFQQLLESLGLAKSKDTGDLDNAATNPGSPWNPSFWKTGPVGTYLLTVATMQSMYNTLKDSFGVFNDDEAQAIGVFKTLRTQSQLSFFADWFNQNHQADLLGWLRGGGGFSSWPNDRLSDAETNEINKYIGKLPKYIP